MYCMVRGVTKELDKTEQLSLERINDTSMSGCLNVKEWSVSLSLL